MEELRDGFRNFCDCSLHVVQNMLYFFRGQTVAFEFGNGFKCFFQIDKFVIVLDIERIIPAHGLKNFLQDLLLRQLVGWLPICAAEEILPVGVDDL